MDFLVDLKDIRGKKYKRVILNDVQVNPKLIHSLFSINKQVKDGFHLVGGCNELYIVQYQDQK